MEHADQFVRYADERARLRHLMFEMG
jgi:hypothetical protein